MDFEHFKTMAYSTLNDSKYYEHLEKKSSQNKYDSLQKTDRQTQNCLTEKEESYLLQFDSKDSNLIAISTGSRRFIKVHT